MKIGIVGNGTVGSALAATYKNFAEVRTFDKQLHKGTHTWGPTLMCDLVFVCVPTDQVEEFFNPQLGGGETEPDWRRRNFVLKSTVPIGTTRRLSHQYNIPNLVHSPEFLTERTAKEDAANPKRLVIGVPAARTHLTKDTSYFEMSDCSRALQQFYVNHFRAVARVTTMTSDESEALKLFDNAFGAVKVSLFNEFNRLADRLGLDWKTILDGLIAGGRVGEQYTQVPGPDGKRGWGGRCWPKDLDILIDCFLAAGLHPSICLNAMIRNSAVDRREG